MKNYYEILGLNKGASQEEIRKAYLKMAQTWHPDKHQGEEEKKIAEEKFKNIGEAYENLKNGIESDEDKQSHHINQDDINQDDINNMMRDFARQSGFNFGFNPQHQQDFYEEISCPVTIQNLYNEEEVLVSFNMYERHEVETCKECGGTGQKVHVQQQGYMIINRATICYKCQGKGFTTTGLGTKKDFKFNSNVSNLHRLRPLGKVGSYNPITNDYNNVMVRLDLQKSLNYSLVENGASLMMVLPVLYEHLRDGKKLKIKLFGNNVTVDVPKKPSLQRMLVVPNKGMPLGNRQRGNLYVKLDLKYE